jgi:hypothetical protein
MPFPTWQAVVSGATDLIRVLTNKPAEFVWTIKMRTFLTSLNANLTEAKLRNGDILYAVDHVNCSLSDTRSLDSVIYSLDKLNIGLTNIDLQLNQLRQAPIYDSHQVSVTKLIDAVGNVRTSRKMWLGDVPQWCTLKPDRRKEIRADVKYSISDANAGIAATNFLLAKLQ